MTEEQIDNIRYELVNRFRSIVDETFHNGFTIVISDINCFRMEKYYYGYPDKKWCYKMNINFEFCKTNSSEFPGTRSQSRDICMNRIYDKFIDLFGKDYYVENGDQYTYNNELLEYITFQYSRIIIQFYPDGWIGKLRDEKLTNLLNE